MNWLYFAFASVFLVGGFNSYLESTKQNMPDVSTKLLYLSSILIGAGLISMVVMLYHRQMHQSTYQAYLKKVNMVHIAIPAFMICSYLLTNTIALSAGGGIAMAIINMNMFVTMYAGYLFFDDKLNWRIMVLAVLGLACNLSAVLYSKELNKN